MPARPDQLGDVVLAAVPDAARRGSRRACAGRCARITSRPTVARASRSAITGSSIAPLRAGEGDDRLELPGEADLLAERRDTTLEAEQRHRDPPPVTGLADDEVGGGPGAGEEDLVELRGAGELADRPDLDPGLVERDEQERQARVALRAGLGAGEHEAPVGQVRQRGPHLLPVEDPLVARPAEPWSRPRRGPSRRRARCSPGTTAPAPCGSARRKRCFCSSVPNARRVGPSSSSPRWLTRAGASARAYSSWKITCCARLSPRPPCSRGQPRQVQPCSARCRSQARRSSKASCSLPGPPLPRRAANSPVEVLLEPGTHLGAEAALVASGRPPGMAGSLPSTC